MKKICKYYPSSVQIDDWCARLTAAAEAVAVRVEALDTVPIRLEFGNSPNTLESRYVRFTANDGRRDGGDSLWAPARHQTVYLFEDTDTHPLPGQHVSLLRVAADVRVRGDDHFLL